MTGFGAGAETPSAKLQAEPPNHSLAFESFVKDEKDVQGLLAYALYKEHIRQQAMMGESRTTESRRPSPALIDAFRRAAELRIGEVVEDAITQATPSLRLSAATDAAESLKGEVAALESVIDAKIKASQTEIAKHVDSRTNNWVIIGLNIVGWILSLAIVFLISFGISHTGPDQVISNAGQTLGINAKKTSGGGQ